VTIQYKFDPGIDTLNQDRIKAAVTKAFAAGEIISCKCPTVEAWVYETRPPDFQASISCSCDVMRPLFSSTPDTDD
jgi:hypothetical protein